MKHEIYSLNCLNLIFYSILFSCRDVSVHTIHSLDAYEMNNSLRNNITVHSMENNDSL